MGTSTIQPLAASRNLLQVTRPPTFLSSSREATLTGAFFCDVIGQAGAVDHVHALICVQNTLTPMQVRPLGGAKPWQEVGTGFRVWMPGDEQRRESKAPVRNRFLFLRPQQFERIAHRPCRSALAVPGRSATVPSDFVDHLFASLAADCADGCPGGTLVGDGLVVALVNWLLARTPGHAKSERAEPLAAVSYGRLVDFVEARLDQPLSIDDLAAVVGLSTRHFCRVLKATTGTTPHQFVLERRVEKASELIRRGDRDLADIAVAAGFSDQSRMSKVFRRFRGVTPGAFRASLG